MDKDSLMRIGDKVLSKIPLLKKKAKIVAKKEVAKETLLVKFKVAEGEVNFNPGQFVFVELPKLLYPDENGNRHHFTILNSPNEKGIISITTRIRDTGFKRTLRELPEGTEVEVGPIAGFFTLPNDVSRPLVFIALGIGITPYISMLRYIEEEGLKHKVTLIYSDSDEESLSYLDELKKMEKTFKKACLDKSKQYMKCFMGNQIIRNGNPMWDIFLVLFLYTKEKNQNLFVFIET